MKDLNIVAKEKNKMNYQIHTSKFGGNSLKINAISDLEKVLEPY